MSSSPYSKLEDHSFWRKSISSIVSRDVDPVTGFDFKIDRDTKVATAGSCFAQHIARYLKLNGFNYYIEEKGHPILSEPVREEFNYGTFSARYGNLYTSRQLLQLFKRVYGKHQPIEDVWKEGEAKFIDPFRPNIQPDGFACEEELIEDRKQHFKAVRNLFESLDVFVFTLGLTECWEHSDGSVFPLCPGVAGGVFNKKIHHFLNLKASDVVDDMSNFLDLLKVVNPKAKVILTVSPVPLIATASSNHVLVSTTYSKSVLRVAAEEVQEKYSNVSYFPSYEVITGSFSRGSYFADDLRNVTEEGVQHVMQLFFKHVTNIKIDVFKEQINVVKENVFFNKMKNIVDVICEENLVDK